MPIVLGVDSSTQSTKVEARDAESGRVVATGTGKHPPTTPPVSEQDPRAWWDALVAAVRQLGEHRNDVVAMSVAGQQHGLVLLDAADEPVRPAKLWNDTTSAPQAERLVLEEKERAQVTLQSIGEAVIRTDAAGLIDYMNPVAESLTGWTLFEGRGRPIGAGTRAAAARCCTARRARPSRRTPALGGRIGRGAASHRAGQNHR